MTADSQLKLAGFVSYQVAYRICFRWTESGLADVEVTDYH